jgi:hypothetical protein
MKGRCSALQMAYLLKRVALQQQTHFFSLPGMTNQLEIPLLNDYMNNKKHL